MTAQFPQEIEDFANVFVLMQERRHSADYDPHARFSKSVVAQDIQGVRRAITGFSGAPTKDRRAFCAFVLFRKRP